MPTFSFQIKRIQLVFTQYISILLTPLIEVKKSFFSSQHRDFFTFFHTTTILGLVIALESFTWRTLVTNKQMNSFLSVLTLFLLFHTSPLFAASAPITIEADHMTSLEQENNVLFSGNVDATQGDVRIRSDKMTVYYTAAEDGKKQEVKRLKCVGNVEITKGEWLGTGKTMNYLAKERKVILSGGAKAWQGTNLITGNTIIYYLDEGRSEVVGSRPSSTVGGNSGKPDKPTRVKATLTPK
jgi:lipopolysaccharide export system protein LptA